MAVLDKAADYLDYLVDILGRLGMNGGGSEVKALCILPEFLDILLGDGFIVSPLFVGLLDNFIVNVGEILNESDLVTPVFEIPSEHVKDTDGAGVADVDIVIDRRAAGIYLYLALGDGLEFLFFSGQGVEDLQYVSSLFYELFQLLNFCFEPCNLLGDRVGNMHLIEVVDPHAVTPHDLGGHADGR